MHDLIWLAIVPTLLLAAGVISLPFWPVRGQHQADPGADTRSLQQRWEDGPPPARRPRPEVGSMDLEAETAWRFRCDDTGEHASTVMLPRLGNAIGYDSARGPWTKAPGQPRVYEEWPGPVPVCCPRCQAPDDGPHYELCPFYDPDEAALFADRAAVLRPIEARARVLDPDAWRPYLSAEEFAGQFPGVPYQPDDGPHTGDLVPVSPELADQFDQLAEETADWLAQRAAAHADLRARLLLAWQAIRQN